MGKLETNHTKNNKKSQIELKTYDETPEWLKASYLLTDGYRPQIPSCCDCASTAFQWHNETLNIWTHGVPGLLQLIISFYLIFEIGSIYNAKIGKS